MHTTKKSFLVNNHVILTMSYYYYHYKLSFFWKYGNIVLYVDLELAYNLKNILFVCLFACVIADSEYTDNRVFSPE